MVDVTVVVDRGTKWSPLDRTHGSARGTPGSYFYCRLKNMTKWSSPPCDVAHGQTDPADGREEQRSGQQ